MKERVCLLFCREDEQFLLYLSNLFKENKIYPSYCSDEGDFCVKAYKKPTFCVIILPKLSNIDLKNLKRYMLDVLSSNEIKFALIHPLSEKIPEIIQKEVIDNQFFVFSSQDIDQEFFEKINQKLN